MAGGNQSAWGYRYQYLATIERFLRYLRDHLGELANIALLVEPTNLATLGFAQDDDIVDFAIENDEVVVERTQVKSSRDPSQNRLAPLESDRVFQRLEGVEASRSVLLTNRPLGPGLEERCVLASSTDIQDEWSHYIADGVIVVDKRSFEDLATSIEDMIRQFRQDQHLGLSDVSCRVIAKLLLDRVFQSATGDAPSRFDALAFVKFLSMPDNEIAHTVGNFDWGIPVGGLPTLPPTVPRLALLEVMQATVGQLPEQHQPEILIAIGQTGYGKSALAAHFCHLNRTSYEFICWIPCGVPNLIVSEIRRLTEELTRTTIAPGVDPSGRFREALASHRGPWLVVFDSAAQRGDIERFLPTQGNGAVVVTTTNETGWWPEATTLAVEPFTEAEALACFASYSGLDSASSTGAAAREVVERLGYIPLAISMAGVYFRNANGTVEELSVGYFDQLDALDDIGSIPPGYEQNRTAFAAIEHAIRNLGVGLGASDTPDALAVERLLYRASLISPTLIPLNYLIASTPTYLDINLAYPPKPTFAEAGVLRRYVSIMRTQSIAQRLLMQRDDEELNEASETIEIHALVHEILRRIYLRQTSESQVGHHVIMMMHTLQGWIGEFRLGSLYFVVDQLISHAEALLEEFPTTASLCPVDAEQEVTACYVLNGLRLELSTCKIARGDVYASVNLAREALLELCSLPDGPIREAMALKAASSIVVDLCEGGIDADKLRIWAQYALLAATNCEALGASGASAAYGQAYTVRDSLTMRPAYLADEAIATVIAAFDEMLERDTSDEIRPSEVMRQLHKLLDSGELEGVEPLMATLRSVSNDFDKHVVDCMEVEIALRKGQFDQAFAAIEELLRQELHATYGARPLSRGLAAIWRTIEKMIADGGERTDELREMSPRIRARAEHWHELIGAQTDDDS
ncbi:NB-ARC domain-containing protein [Mycobacteroides salmoniphilum]|uniref:NB-ARC domain protein n=1 Tax=Mycobacteroides salmoniphilum TaxID=404941 RepID=A0A4R8SHF0_9MYCO|nr:NB-ARC domain-containing protein [Mycobacteroides salmoniphilum]TDZ96337.1 hypothetical protein CCUG60885_02481 [Mycobacteroides salmoniphilum]TEA05432.1 hypothetical protein CCUG60883_02738 [Mycobacteroides salmoniphilum]